MDTAATQCHELFDRSPAGMVMLDPGGEIRYGNGVVAAMFAVSQGQLPGSRFSSFLFSDDQEAFEDELAALHSGAQRQFQTTLRYTTRQDEIAWARLHFTLVDDDASAGAYVFGVVEDITAEKSGQEQLRRDKESAERATRTKSAFLANMSHEIRTPLHTITGVTELLHETDLDEEQVEYANQIKFSAEVLLGLINDVLDFSKIEAGKLSLEIIEFDLFEMVQEAVDMLSLEAHKKDLEVIVHLDPTLPRYVRGDPVRLRQILVNLFNNAVKFTSEGEIVIRTRRVYQMEDALTVSIEVADSGIGIPREKIARLFKAFSQVDSSTTRKFGGTGLGLSISRSLVKMMKGNIGVKSSEGKGSTFWFTVPLGLDAVETVLNPELARGTRILVVDDHTMARDVLRRYLEAVGATVEEAESGARGIETLRENARQGHPFDVAFIDLLMPGMDGWQTASEINADKKINSTKLILLSPTGRSAGEAKMKLLKWFDAYLSKPLKVDDISEALAGVLATDMDLPALEEGRATETEEAADAEEVEELEEPDAEEVSAETGAERSAGAAAHPGEAGAGAGADADTGADDTTGADAATSPGRILVAEDHFVNQQLFKTILEKRGFETVLAADGREAIERTREGAVDLVFMDVHMPEVSGYEATRIMREEGFDVPIIAVTANVTKGEKERCVAAGMNDYLAKPFKSRDLMPLIERWLHVGRTSAAAAARERSVGETTDVEERAGAAAGEGAGAGRPPEEERSAEEGGRPVFDYGAALDAFMRQAEVLDRVIARFLDRTADQIEEIRGNIDAGDFERARVAAHTIKGGAWNLEALRLGDRAALLEQAARDSDETAARRELELVSEEFSELRRRVSETEELQV
ncbi:MAG: response regulator [Spirochaetaceae bacterium]